MPQGTTLTSRSARRPQLGPQPPSRQHLVPLVTRRAHRSPSVALVTLVATTPAVAVTPLALQGRLRSATASEPPLRPTREASPWARTHRLPRHSDLQPQDPSGLDLQLGPLVGPVELLLSVSEAMLVPVPASARGLRHLPATKEGRSRPNSNRKIR